MKLSKSLFAFVLATGVVAAGIWGWREYAVGAKAAATAKDQVAPAAETASAPQELVAQNQASVGSSPNGVPARLPPPVPVLTAEAVQHDFPIRRRTIGWVEPVASVVVRPRIDGQLREQKVQNGQFVKEGDLLFVLDDRAANAAVTRSEAAIAKDRALLTRSQNDLKRAQELTSKGAGTQQQLDQATADSRSAEATLAADQAQLLTDQLTLSYTQIRAPISGRLGSIQVTPGNLVKGNDSASSLVTITQMDPVRVSFSLPDRELSALRAAVDSSSPAEVKVFVKGQTEPKASGLLDFVDSTVDTSSGTILSKAKFSNENLALWPGQYVDVEISLGNLSNVPVIPSVAIQASQTGMFVYVIKPDKTVERRPVTVAATDRDQSAIASGLSGGERVVVEGQLRISSGTRVADQPMPAPTDQAKRLVQTESGSNL